MTAWLSLRVLRRHGFDILHACNPPETYFALAWFYKGIGKRFLFDHHDLSPEMYLAKGGNSTGCFTGVSCGLRRGPLAPLMSLSRRMNRTNKSL